MSDTALKDSLWQSGVKLQSSYDCTSRVTLRLRRRRNLNSMSVEKLQGSICTQSWAVVHIFEALRDQYIISTVMHIKQKRLRDINLLVTYLFPDDTGTVVRRLHLSRGEMASEPTTKYHARVTARSPPRAKGVDLNVLPCAPRHFKPLSLSRLGRLSNNLCYWAKKTTGERIAAYKKHEGLGFCEDVSSEPTLLPSVLHIQGKEK